MQLPPSLRQLSSRKLSRREFLGLIALGVGSVFGVASLIEELTSYAATPAVSFEPEGGTLTPGASAVSDSTASSKAAVRFSAETAASGAPFWGVAHGGNTMPTVIETPAGRPVGVHRTYYEGTQVTQGISMARADVAAHRVPWISFKLPDTWANAKRGSCDAWATDICSQLGALAGPVMLTWHHEPEQDESPITDFVAMHDRLYQFSKPYANIKCGPILTAWDWLYGSVQAPATWGQYQLDTVWPGAFNSGDFLGIDAYCSYLTAKGGKWLFLGDAYWRPIAAFAASKGVDWAVGEFGISAGAAAYNRSITGGNASGTSGGDITWLREAYSTATSLGGCLALSYFDSGLNSTTNAASAWTTAALVGHPAWPLESQTVGSTTYPADTGSPSKFDVFVDVLKQSPTWRAHW